MTRTALRLAAAALGLALVGGARAEPFTIMIYETPAEVALRTDTSDKGKAYWGSYGAFAQQAQAAGILRGGSALHTGKPVVSFIAKDGAMAKTNEPFAQSALMLSGYFQIDVADQAAALAWARKIPAAATGAVEIRAGFPAPGM